MRSAAAVLIALAAICLQRAATLPWATLPIGGGQVYVSPIGLRIKDDVGGTAGSCRWWPKMGDESLCAVASNGAERFRRLRMVYPLLTAGIWIGVIALFLQVLRLPRWPWLRSEITWIVTALSTVAVVIMLTSVTPALALSRGNPAQFGGAGFILGCAGALLSAASGVLAVVRRS